MRSTAIRSHERHYEDYKIWNEAIKEAGLIAVRSLFLINGGAAIAMLAFFANIIQFNAMSDFRSGGEALLFFCVGVAFASASACSTYITNYLYLTSKLQCILIWEHPYIEYSKKSKYWELVGAIFHCTTIFMVFASLACFLYGVFKLYCDFEKLI